MLFHLLSVLTLFALYWEFTLSHLYALGVHQTQKNVQWRCGVHKAESSIMTSSNVASFMALVWQSSSWLSDWSNRIAYRSFRGSSVNVYALYWDKYTVVLILKTSIKFKFLLKFVIDQCCLSNISRVLFHLRCILFREILLRIRHFDVYKVSTWFLVGLLESVLTVNISNVWGPIIGLRIICCFWLRNC